jgi:hypothetical protein
MPTEESRISLTRFKTILTRASTGILPIFTDRQHTVKYMQGLSLEYYKIISTIFDVYLAGIYDFYRVTVKSS